MSVTCGTMNSLEYVYGYIKAWGNVSRDYTNL